MKTKGEILFESYLITQGLSNFTFERDFHGKKKRPDYCVPIDGREYLFDVKDFDDLQLPDSGQYDEYKRIRGRIHKGKEKFKEYKDWVCCLVLYSNNARLLGLLESEIIFSSMYGNLGITWSVNLASGSLIEGTEHSDFLSGGKMGHPKSNQPQNTTISALITLRHVYKNYIPLGLGVIVWENTIAAKPFPEGIFNGRFDERYRLVDNGFGRIYCGEGIQN